MDKETGAAQKTAFLLKKAKFLRNKVIAVGFKRYKQVVDLGSASPWTEDR